MCCGCTSIPGGEYRVPFPISQDNGLSYNGRVEFQVVISTPSCESAVLTLSTVPVINYAVSSPATPDVTQFCDTDVTSTVVDNCGPITFTITEALDPSHYTLSDVGSGCYAFTVDTDD